MHHTVNPLALARSLTEQWSPRVIAELDDHHVKVAKVQGELPWHAHPHEDELFYVLSGRLRIEMPGTTVELGPGEACVVPRGVLHHPQTDAECCLMCATQPLRMRSPASPAPVATLHRPQARKQAHQRSLGSRADQHQPAISARTRIAHSPTAVSRRPG